MKKIFLVLFIFVFFFYLSTTNLIAQSCLSGGINGTCTSQAACDPNTSTYSKLYSPVNICLSVGGCCTIKPTTIQNCFSAGASGTCSSSSACNSNTSTWYGVYSPVNACLGLGGGCCVTNPPPATSSVLNCANGTGIETAIGCIRVLDTPEAFLGDILRWAVGIGGGIAFLLILYAGFMVMTSAGNPERLKAGQELLTSAISGLILLIFSVFILKFIGIDILGLCNFGFGQIGTCPI